VLNVRISGSPVRLIRKRLTVSIYREIGGCRIPLRVFNVDGIVVAESVTNIGLCTGVFFFGGEEGISKTKRNRIGTDGITGFRVPKPRWRINRRRETDLPDCAARTAYVSGRISF